MCRRVSPGPAADHLSDTIPEFLLRPRSVCHAKDLATLGSTPLLAKIPDLRQSIEDIHLNPHHSITTANPLTFVGNLSYDLVTPYCWVSGTVSLYYSMTVLQHLTVAKFAERMSLNV
jgi:hypothetical protein